MLVRSEILATQGGRMRFSFNVRGECNDDREKARCDQFGWHFKEMAPVKPFVSYGAIPNVSMRGF